MRRKPFSREQTLSAKPIKNTLVHWERNEQGEVILHLPRQKNRWTNLLDRLFFPLPEEKVISLDEVGTKLWDLCDGKTSVREIIERLQSKFNLSRKESEVSSLEYLKKLAQRRIIGFAVPKNWIEEGRSHGARKRRRNK